MLKVMEISGGCWSIGSVKSEPSVELLDWSVFEVLLPGLGVRTRHFAGTSVFSGEGRVCSPVQSFDATSRRGVTSSGRVYGLVGNRTGLCSDAKYVWDIWTSLNNAQDIVDVTDDIKCLVDGGQDAGT